MRQCARAPCLPVTCRSDLEKEVPQVNMGIPDHIGIPGIKPNVRIICKVLKTEIVPVFLKVRVSPNSSLQSPNSLSKIKLYSVTRGSNPP